MQFNLIQWNQLYALKPDVNCEIQEDIENVKFVKENMGDFKLKSSANYAVLENKILNAYEVKTSFIELIEKVNLKYIKFKLLIL